MSESVRIIDYRDFYDVPRTFLVEWSGRTFLFDCPFNDELDDYPDYYTVYVCAEASPWLFMREWPTAAELGGKKIAVVPVSHVKFDPTRRASIDSKVLADLGVSVAA